MVMNSKERRAYILKKLVACEEPQKGNLLALEIGVTRQIIVKDIAILRAEGKNIIATPEGYIITKEQRPKVKRIIAVCHNSDFIEEELEIIVKYGGIVEDVIVEHPLYGEIKGMLMIRSMNDISNFMKKFKEVKAEPLSRLTGGVHIHTIIAEDEETLDKIIKELRVKNFIACD
jgi:transcriptional regulator of NAD metabolism